MKPGGHELGKIFHVSASRTRDSHLDRIFASTLQFLPMALTALDFSAFAVNACMDARVAKGLPWEGAQCGWPINHTNVQ